LLLILLLGFLSAAAVSPELHRWVCPNADEPDDQCVVTVLAAGLVLGSATHIDATVVIRWIVDAAPPIGEAPHVTAHHRFPPSRAPPSGWGC
jgi:hypothetical protein